MRVGLHLFLVLCFSAGSMAEPPPLVTSRYAIQAVSWEEHIAQAPVFAEALKAAMRTARPYKKKPSVGPAYLAAAQVIADAVGHHEMAFLFLRRARRSLEAEGGKGASTHLKQCDQLESQLSASKLEALSSLGDPLLPMPGELSFTAAENTLRLRAVPNQRTPDGGDYQLSAHFTDLRGGRLMSVYREVNELDPVRWSHDLFAPGAAPQSGEIADLFASAAGGYFLDTSRSKDCLPSWRPTAKSCLWGELNLPSLVYIHPPGSTFYSVYGLKGTMGAVLVETEGTRRGVMVTSLRDRWWMEFDKEKRTYPLREQMADVLRFATSYPQSQEILRGPIGEITFAEAKAIDQIGLYRTYIESFPDGPHVAEARRRLAEKEYEATRRTNTIEDYKEFVAEFPEHPLVEKARDAIEILRIEDLAREATGDQLEAAVRRLARKAAIERGEELLERTRFVEASNTNTVAAYRRFLSRYPDGTWSEAARRSIDEIHDGARFSAVRRANREDAYRAFLAAHPETRFVHEAKAMLSYFEFERDSSLEAARSFFEHYREATLKSVANAEYSRVMERLRSLASRPRTDCPARLILFDETRELQWLLEAPVANQDEEFEVLKRFSPELRAKTFPLLLSDFKQKPTWDVSWFLAQQKTGGKLTLEGRVKSLAKKGRYRLDVEYALSVDYEKYYSGVTWFRPNHESERQFWSETFRSVRTVEVGPSEAGDETVSFEFPKIVTQETPGFEFIVGWTTVGTLRFPGEYRVLNVELLSEPTP